MLTKTDATDDLGRWLFDLIPRFEVKTIFEAHCGEVGWLARLPVVVGYTGWDTRKTYIKTNMKRYPFFTFAVADIARESPPPADLYLLRDVSRNTDAALDAVIASDCRYLITLSEVAASQGFVAHLAQGPAMDLSLYDMNAERIWRGRGE